MMRSPREPWIATAGWPTITARATRDGRSSANQSENSPPREFPTSVTWSMSRPSSRPAMTLTACSRTEAPARGTAAQAVDREVKKQMACREGGRERRHPIRRRRCVMKIPVAGARPRTGRAKGRPDVDQRSCTRSRRRGDPLLGRPKPSSTPWARHGTRGVAYRRSPHPEPYGALPRPCVLATLDGFRILLDRLLRRYPARRRDTERAQAALKTVNLLS